MPRLCARHWAKHHRLRNHKSKKRPPPEGSGLSRSGKSQDYFFTSVVGVVVVLAAGTSTLPALSLMASEVASPVFLVESAAGSMPAALASAEASTASPSFLTAPSCLLPHEVNERKVAARARKSTFFILKEELGRNEISVFEAGTGQGPATRLSPLHIHHSIG